MSISWQQFELCNQNKREAFENLCRALFRKNFFDDSNVILHSNPNNPGIEIEPVFCDKLNKSISFQSKYFDTIDYGNIQHSAKETVKYYSGQIDICYLYSNKDLNTKSKGYEDAKKILNDSGIELVSITNQEILEQVSQYDYLSNGYFNNLSLTKSWFEDKLYESIESLGDRHNQFNIVTECEEFLDLFLKNAKAIDYINSKPNNTIKIAKEIIKNGSINNSLLNRIIECVSNIKGVTFSNILDCYDWKNNLYTLFQTEFENIQKEYEEKNKKLSNSNYDTKTRRKLREESYYLERILSIPNSLAFTDYEKCLIDKKCLIVKGEGGTGKTQLLSNKCEELVKSGIPSLLILGQNFISSIGINKQILDYLALNCTVDELFSILECFGEAHCCDVPIFIDAINESTNREIWKAGLNTLINKVKKYSFIKLVVSVRTGYESFVFDDAINKKIENQDITLLVHRGFFNESLEALISFLNYYEIPFSPSYSLIYEMTNPLILKLFCETYDGEDVDLSRLFHKLILKVDYELQKNYDIDISFEITKNILYSIVEYQLINNNRVSKLDFLKLEIWDTFGISSKKTNIIKTLCNAGLINSFAYDGVEYYYLGYNVLDDYISAEYIICEYETKDKLDNYISNNLLRVENNKIENLKNVGIFTILCNFYYERYHYEVINDYIDLVTNNFIKQDLIKSYIESYQWRNNNCINPDLFLQFVRKHQVKKEYFFSVLFQNATKPNNPLNSVFLHNFLSNKELNVRDCLWTTYINHEFNDENRVFQLVELFKSGEKFKNFDNESLRLLLLLFSWFLTSSNRFLRDSTSKAIIEILKDNFELCIELLKRFEGVNDPYVIQRLYGIIFGVCTKRSKEYKQEYEELIKYVYSSIFNKEFVYPDILLRDYAKLIIDRYVYEFRPSNLDIDLSRIKPPYKSKDIPVVEEFDYSHCEDGTKMIYFSMQPAMRTAMYGDFGRYVFESAVNRFKDVDVENIFNYAMSFIIDELGYNDKMFSKYDSEKAYHGARNATKKIERIGKKYQWIAMYNILARISDRHILHGYSNDYPYKGTWEPFVRDFDPTLTSTSAMPHDMPEFLRTENNYTSLFCENKDIKSIKEWLSNDNSFFKNHVNSLILKDGNDIEWVVLHQFKRLSNNKGQKNGGSLPDDDYDQIVWKTSSAFFVQENDFDTFKEKLETENFCGDWFPIERECYQLFFREYPWSDGYEDVFDNEENEVTVKVETTETDKNLQELLSRYQPEVLSDNFMQSYETEETIGFVKQAYLIYLWECEYDASNIDVTTLYMPAKDIIEFFNLNQNASDGYYYDNNTLVAFDGERSGVVSGVLIRKDYLLKFLNEKKLKMFWICTGEKQYLKQSHMTQSFSQWSGFLYLNDNDLIQGSISLKDKNI